MRYRKHIDGITVMAIAWFLSVILCCHTVQSATIPVELMISNGLVLSMDEGMTVIKNGSIAVDKGEIIAVGPSGSMNEQYSGVRTIDAAGKLVMPGLVNTHTHAAMTLFRGLADDLPLDAWLTKHIWPAEAKFITPASVRTGVNLALAEMIRSGTTTFCDMYFFADETAQAAKNAGVRAVVGEAVLDFPTPDSKGPKESFVIIEKLAHRWKNDPLITIAVGTHSTYTCSPETLKLSKKLADSLGLPLTIHASETSKEVADQTAKYGLPPIEYLDRLGFFGGRVIVAHAVHPTAKEIRLMAEKRVGVAHNPVSNMKLASGVAPLSEMLQNGITVALGTDGAASNNTLNLFKEMNAAALLQKVTHLEPTAMSARDTVKAATIAGARVLGLEKRIGSLEKGKRADLIIIDLNRPHLVPMYDVYSELVYATSGADVETVLIDGRLVMHNRKLLTLNEENAIKESRKLDLKISEYK